MNPFIVRNVNPLTTRLNCCCTLAETRLIYEGIVISCNHSTIYPGLVPEYTDLSVSVTVRHAQRFFVAFTNIQHQSLGRLLHHRLLHHRLPICQNLGIYTRSVRHASLILTRGYQATFNSLKFIFIHFTGVFNV